MKLNKRILSLFLVLAMAFSLVACGKKDEEVKDEAVVEENNEEVEGREESDEKSDVSLLVYSGAGLKKPMTEIAEVYKEKTGVDIEYVFAGSSQLLGQIELSGKGDVFIVGAIKAYEKAQEKDFVGEYKTVAYHNPVIGVPKGNPAGIEKLEDLAKPGVKVILGDEEANAIGMTTQKIIEKHNLQGINENVVSKTPTVNELIVHLVAGDADAAIITEDSGFGNEDIELISIPEEMNIPQILPIGSLKATEHEKEAEDFVNFVSSDEGKAIFEKYGFPPVRE